MKINGNFEPGSVDKLNKGQAGKKAAKTEDLGASASEQGAVAKLSGKLAGVGGAEAPLNAQKVEAIRQAIAEKSFEVNPEAIADKMIESARALYGQK